MVIITEVAPGYNQVFRALRSQHRPNSLPSRPWTGLEDLIVEISGIVVGVVAVGGD